MKGGIQEGTVAADTMARTLDINLKDISKELRDELKNIPGLKYYYRLPKDKKIGTAGCQPDGGLWFLNDVLIATFEGKKQGDSGNAIERWFKNNFICRSINSAVDYVTFCVGKGAYEQGTMGKILSPAHLGGYNKYVSGGNTCYMSINGFTAKEIKQKMKKIILEHIQ
jgi:hypothetical protein